MPDGEPPDPMDGRNWLPGGGIPCRVAAEMAWGDIVPCGGNGSMPEEAKACDVIVPCGGKGGIVAADPTAAAAVGGNVPVGGNAVGGSVPRVAVGGMVCALTTGPPGAGLGRLGGIEVWCVGDPPKEIAEPATEACGEAAGSVEVKLGRMGAREAWCEESLLSAEIEDTRPSCDEGGWTALPIMDTCERSPNAGSLEGGGRGGVSATAPFVPALPL
mmetsp:Transcript_122653/g.261737  ORF Transcript_122653/g.261737 Transcript_122653/m.261737 type:complete len:216 (-) Transcript_122653:1744-2391(-)